MHERDEELFKILGDEADPIKSFATLVDFIHSKANSGSARVSDLERDLRRFGDEVLRRLLQQTLDQVTKAQSVIHRITPPTKSQTSEQAKEPDSEADLGHESLEFPGVRRPVGKNLRTIFGIVRVTRFVFYLGEGRTAVPMDDQLGLPNRSFSYPLQDIVLRGMANGPVDEALAEVREVTSASIHKRQALEIATEAVADFEEFYRERSRSAVDTTDPFLVVGLDCKGVPIRQQKEPGAPRRLHLKPGEKKQQKKMAVVASIHSTDRYNRSADEIVRNLLDPEHHPDTSGRPRPNDRRVFASVKKSKEQVAQEIVEELERRDPTRTKKIVCLTDGEKSLQDQVKTTIKQSFDNSLLILDLIHVLGYLWGAAHAIHVNGSHEARQFVWERLKKLLSGQLEDVLADLETLINEAEGTGRDVAKIRDAQRYFKNNAKYMKYNEYIEMGLPIASGCAEGACGHLVRDRMERTGASWSLDGAETVLKLRALEKSGDFKEYSQFREAKDRERLFSARYGLAA